MEELGVDIPTGTDTAEYGTIIRENLVKTGTAGTGDYYTKAETDELLSGKLDVGGETDPTVPSYVKSITQDEMEGWETEKITNSELEGIFNG